MVSYLIGLALVIAGLATQHGDFWRAFVLVALGVVTVAFSEWNTKTPRQQTLVQNFERDHDGEVIKATSEQKIT